MLSMLFAGLLPCCFAGQVVEQTGLYLAYLVESDLSLKKPSVAVDLPGIELERVGIVRMSGSGSGSLIAVSKIRVLSILATLKFEANSSDQETLNNELH
jgi:hypothetical protein